MAEQVSEQVWTWVQTPNPAEMIFAVYVETELMTVTTSEKPSNKPVRESALGVVPYVPPTKFKDLAAEFNTAHLCSLGVADWYFIGESIGPSKTVFYFFKNKTTAEVNAPWQTEEEFGNHYWPMVVESVWTELDYGFPQSASTTDGYNKGIVSGPTIYIRDTVLPDIQEGTLFITRRYLSATRPLIPRHRVPIPGAMRVQVNGDSRDYPNVLHPDITIDALPSGTVSVIGSAGVIGIGGGTNRQFFPATNFELRKRYILSDKPVKNAYGLWERTQIEVVPPKLQESISR